MECETYKGIKYCIANGVFMVGDNKTVALVNNALSFIEIPYSIKGKKIKEIGSHAFYECRSLVTVNIIARIKQINTFAFCRCINLVSINIPCTCKLIANYSLDQYLVETKGISSGTLNIFIEKGSKLSIILMKTISWKQQYNIYVCEPIQPTYIDIKYEHINVLNIYSPYTFDLYDKKTQFNDYCYSPPITNICSSMKKYYTNKSLMLFIIIISH